MAGINCKSCNTSYNVFPHNIYQGDIIFPRPYFSYEPKPPGMFLVKSDNRQPNQYEPAVFGWEHTPQGYYEGNLQGHICEDECRSMPEMPYYGNITHTKQKCWCSGPFKDRCANAPGFAPSPWLTEKTPTTYEIRCPKQKKI